MLLENRSPGEELRSMKIPVQGLNSTPVVNFPQERVIVLVFRGSSMASLTGGKAATPIPAAVLLLHQLHSHGRIVLFFVIRFFIA